MAPVSSVEQHCGLSAYPKNHSKAAAIMFLHSVNPAIPWRRIHQYERERNSLQNSYRSQNATYLQYSSNYGRLQLVSTQTEY